MATDIGTKAGTFLTGLNTERLFLGLLVGKDLEADLSTELASIQFLVANSNSSNYCSPSVCHSLRLSVPLCDRPGRYFQYGWI